jgi:peroxiredoxin Q/BCP
MSLNLLSVGDNAPSFTALNQHSKPVSLEDFRGQLVVLYFYPKAMTPGCTTQACGFRDAISEFEQRQVKILGVSPDEPQKLEKFIAKEQLNFDLLSDPDHSLCESYGAWGLKKFMGREYEGVHRITYIISPDGKISHVMPKVKTKTHHDDILQALNSL